MHPVSPINVISFQQNVKDDSVDCNPSLAMDEVIFVIIIIIYLNSNGLSPGGSGYKACTYI